MKVFIHEDCEIYAKRFSSFTRKHLYWGVIFSSKAGSELLFSWQVSEIFNNDFLKGYDRKGGPSPVTPGLHGSLVVLRPAAPWHSQYLRIPWATGIPRTSWPWDPLEPQDLWEITSTIWNLEYQHQGTLKLKHKQRTSLNYIIGHSKRKIACTFSGYLIYRDFIYLTMVIRGQAPLSFPSSYVTVITRNDNEA